MMWSQSSQQEKLRTTGENPKEIRENENSEKT
jgi:hypothetical protein